MSIPILWVHLYLLLILDYTENSPLVKVIMTKLLCTVRHLMISLWLLVKDLLPLTLFLCFMYFPIDIKYRLTCLFLLYSRTF